MLSEKLLGAISAEIAELEAAIAKWREIQRLAGEIVAGDAAAPREAPRPETPRSPRPRPSNGSRNAPRAARQPRNAPRAARQPRGATAERKRAILAALSTHGPLSPGALAERVGEPVANVRGDLRQLLAGAQVTAHGATSSRTYDVARNGSAPTAPMSPRVRKLEHEATPNGAQEVELEDRIIGVLKSVGGRVALSEIEFQLRRRRVEVDRGDVERAARTLVTHNLVIRDAGGGLRLAPEPIERPLEEAIRDAAGVDEL